MRIIIKTLVLLFVSSLAFSQANCDKNLNDARSDYANGNLYAIPGKLTDCLNNGFTKSQKIDAYQLLALTYININQVDKAKESLIKLLKIKTDYTVIKNVDPDELYSLYKKIDTSPIYYLGGGGGLNFTFPLLRDSTERYTTNSNPGEDNYNYSTAMSFFVGAQFLYPVTQIFHAKTALSYDMNKYKYSQTDRASISSENETETKYTSTNAGLNLLIAGRIMSEKKIYGLYKPFLEAGLITRYHLNSKIIDYDEKNSINAQSFLSSDIKMNKYRKKINLGMNLQIGSMIKLEENFIELAIGATYYTIPETNYEDTIHRNFTTVAEGKTVIEDLYKKIVFNFTINFNVPFYNFK